MADDFKQKSVDDILAASPSNLGSTIVKDMTGTTGLGNPSGNVATQTSKAAEIVDQILQATPVGPLGTAIGDSFYGINHRQTPNAIQINKDYFGYTFFTRPLLNMTSDNLRIVRKMAPLLTTEPASVQRIIRCTLDPLLAETGISSPFVDNQQAFIPILSNHLLSMSGWPDVNLPTFTSPEGVYKEAFSFVDGNADNYGTYDITANFRNIPGNPIMLLFYIWGLYSAYVATGVMVPYPEFVVQNEIDYNTRIYRLVMDSSKTYVKGVAACGAAFVTSIPKGAQYNFEADRPINSAMFDQISIPMRMIGAMYDDDILIYEFNMTVCMFNNGMMDGTREQHYKEIPAQALSLFNNRGYPRINPNTYKLEWWVPLDEYNYRLPK